MYRHGRCRHFRPAVETLEARAVPSVCTVDRLSDLGQGSGRAGDLRYCITQAQNGDSIAFRVRGTINLTRALPNLTRDISIEGPGANLMTVRRDTGGTYRIFTVSAGVTAGISGLTISNGNSGPGGGGGILNGGSLTVSDSTISGNTALGGYGGGIFNDGARLTVSHSTISGNTANAGGGIENNNTGRVTVSDSTIFGNTAGNGGGIDNTTGTLTVSNSTVSGNLVENQGGGIANRGTLTVSNSTVAENTARKGGGIDTGGPGSMAARNTIIAGNTADLGPDVFGNLGSRGHNLLGNPQEASGWVGTDLLHVNPRLGPLRDNGGPTLTHALLPGSPAIDAGDNADAPETDQRGLPRVTGNVLDIGAFEVQPGPAAFFYLVAPESALAGVPFDLLVIAFDGDGYLATNYTGTVAFYSATDPDAVLPEAYTFTAGDAGWVYLPESAVLYAEGPQEVWAYDVETFAAGLAIVEVFPGGAPGSGLNPPWGHLPDAAALLALLTEQTRLRP